MSPPEFRRRCRDRSPASVPSLIVVAFVTTLVATASAGAQVTVERQIYSCEDENGRTISSDRPIADCARRELRVLNRDGSLRQLIAPPLTREQTKHKQREAQLRQEEQSRLRAQQARDRSLLLTFEDEQALESMRRRRLADVDHEIRLATMRILTLDKDMKGAQAEAERVRKEREGRPLPFSFQQRINDAANAILAEDSLIRERQAERERINDRFDADARRLRELLGRPTAPSTLAQERSHVTETTTAR